MYQRRLTHVTVVLPTLALWNHITFTFQHARHPSVETRVGRWRQRFQGSVQIKTKNAAQVNISLEN